MGKGFTGSSNRLETGKNLDRKRKRRVNMSAEGDLWDDSALINAFDNAMSKYKQKMHGKENREANVPIFVDQSSDEAIKHRDAGENSNATSNTITETAEGKEQYHSQMPDPYIDSSNNLPTQDKQDGQTGYADYSEDYNQLLTQYYEVEEKRQKILQQLQQYGSWNYQYPAEGSSAVAQLGTSTSQECPLLTSQGAHSTVTCSCCPYVCQSSVIPCTSYPCCSFGGTSVGKTSTEPNAATVHGNSLAVIDSDIVKTAMGAAEKAISSMTTKASINHNVDEENKEKKDGEGEVNQSSTSETDLTVLLNAWYSAGFHTGKYLMEQSIAKKQHK
ncbi:hypothetical protein CCACVL1_15040 [Corchorus capsularis]|uniref:Survival Motor Neuron Gemin2-binding domain-containing protein n=1 Tax=Corchorus capsularis TaxID=210143 RepID=A0A1R3I475_COCAP|nr:hypothetical protein CCACVL1_15040 [Corchorus capsularis]